jgi:hypothetical protein
VRPPFAFGFLIFNSTCRFRPVGAPSREFHAAEIWMSCGLVSRIFFIHGTIYPHSNQSVLRGFNRDTADIVRDACQKKLTEKRQTAQNGFVSLLELLQLRVLRLGLFQDGDVGVGVFPEGEEILIGGERPNARDIDIRSPRGSRLQGIGTSHFQMG